MAMNIESITDFSPAWTFKDSFLKARPWFPMNFNTATGQIAIDNVNPPSLDALGWPTHLERFTNAQGQVIQQYLNSQIFDNLQGRYPGGLYRAEWEGTGTVLWMGDLVVTSQGVDAQGKHFANLQVTPANLGIFIRIASMDPADPIRNMHVWMPDYNGESFVGQVWHPGADFSPFHPLFLERLEGFTTLRFMQMMETNTSQVVHWSDRRPWNHATQDTGSNLVPYIFQNGMSPEFLIELANELQSDAWFDMPHMADDDYVRNFATLVKNTLDPNLKAYVEWGNEIWNLAPGYAGGRWVIQQQQLPENAGLSFNQIWAREALRDFDVWADVFSDQPERLVRTMASFIAMPVTTTELLQNLHGRFDAVAVGGYFGPSFEVRQLYNASTTLEQVMADTVVGVADAVTRTRNQMNVVVQFEQQLGRDIPIVIYEGGPDFESRNPESFQVMFDATLDPRMREFTESFLFQINELGVDLYAHFQYTSRGVFGALHAQDQPVEQLPVLQALLEATSGRLFTPQLRVEAVTAEAHERNQTPGMFRVTRGGDLDVPLTVNFQLGGTALATDYTGMPATITFVPGQRTFDIPIVPINDARIEEDRQLQLTLTSGAGYLVVPEQPSATITIKDDDGLVYYNLPIQNPSFETGDLSGWTLVPSTTNPTAVVSGTFVGSPDGAHHGTYYGWGAGTNNNTSGANPAAITQRIDLSSQATGIDSGQAQLTVNGWGAGGFGTASANVELRFFDAPNGGNQLGATIAGAPATTLRSWTPLIAAGAVPVGARSVEVRAITARGIHNIAQSGFDDFTGYLTLPAAAQATSVTATSSGFVAHFSNSIVAEGLNLYDEDNTLGIADVTLVGATTGEVHGSLLISSDARSMTFIRTGGTLPADTYVARFRSATGALRDRLGNLLDGDYSGAAGGDYVGTLVVASPPAEARVLSIPDFARGYGQQVNVPATTTTGLPITLSNAQGVGRVEFSLHYDPALLEITAATLNLALAGAALTFDNSTSGVVTISIESPTQFSAVNDPLTFVHLTASVPSNSPYGSKQLLDLSNVHILTSGPMPSELPAIDDDGIHLAAFYGDASGSQSYNAPDATAVQRLIVGASSGFLSYPLADPHLIAEVSGNGLVQSNDVTLIQRAIVGLPAAEIPPLPILPQGSPPASADPIDSISQNISDSSDDTALAPLQLLVTWPDNVTASSGPRAVDYDPAPLEPTDAELGELLVGVGLHTQSSTAGLMQHSFTGSRPLELTQSMSGTRTALEITNLSQAPPLASFNLLGNGDLLATALDDDLDFEFALQPTRANAEGDAIDGLVTILDPAPLDGRALAAALDDSQSAGILLVEI